MADTTATPGRRFDDWLKTIGLLLGLASTGLGVYVAVKAQFISATASEIDAQVRATQAETARIQQQLSAQELDRRRWDSSVRLVAQWHVMNANEFARGLDDGTLRPAWVDDTLQRQLTTAAQDWKRHNRLMSRGPDQGLLLRQVICLRLLNIGNSPALRLRLQAHVRDFDSSGGGVGGLYTELRQRSRGEPLRELPLGRLMEAGQEARRLTTELVVPVGHAVGSQRYVGRLLVPVQLIWHDERQNREGSLEIDVEDPLLANSLKGADLGRSTGG